MKMMEGRMNLKSKETKAAQDAVEQYFCYVYVGEVTQMFGVRLFGYSKPLVYIELLQCVEYFNYCRSF